MAAGAAVVVVDCKLDIERKASKASLSLCTGFWTPGFGIQDLMTMPSFVVSTFSVQFSSVIAILVLKNNLEPEEHFLTETSGKVCIVIGCA